MSTDATEGVAIPAMLTFTAENWNEPQTVTVTGVDDADPVADGGVSYYVTFGPAVSNDAAFSGANGSVLVTNEDNEEATLVVSKKSFILSSDKNTGTFDVSLKSKPLAEAVVTRTLAHPAAGTLSETALTLTEANHWTRRVVFTGAFGAQELATTIDLEVTSNTPVYVGVRNSIRLCRGLMFAFSALKVL